MGMTTGCLSAGCNMSQVLERMKEMRFICETVDQKPHVVVAQDIQIQCRPQFLSQTIVSDRDRWTRVDNQRQQNLDTYSFRNRFDTTHFSKAITRTISTAAVSKRPASSRGYEGTHDLIKDSSPREASGSVVQVRSNVR